VFEFARFQPCQSYVRDRFEVSLNSNFLAVISPQELNMLIWRGIRDACRKTDAARLKLQRDRDLQFHRAGCVEYQRNGSLGSSVTARGALSIKGELKMASNPFSDVISEVQKSPQNQRTEKLIDGIAQQMQQSGNTQAQQLGQELQSVKSQLVRACQQQG
jgi:hypothetical protein